MFSNDNQKTHEPIRFDLVRFENTDHAELLQDFGWLDIEQLVAYDTAVMLYKVQKDLVPDVI